MAKRKNKKNQQALKGLVVVIIIAIITILGDKIKLDNINNLVEEVSTNNVVANQVSENSNEVIDGENVDVYYLDQTTPNMIQRISEIFERKPLISKEI